MDTDAACIVKSTNLRTGAVAANLPSNENVAWTNVDGARTPGDGVSAIATLPVANDTSRLLTVRGYGFELPAQAVILDITVEVTRHGVDHDDDELYLVRWNGNGAATYGAVNRASPNDWPTVSTAATYTGDPFQWGMQVTPAIANAPDFGVALSAKYDGTTTGDAFIDAIRMSIRYCE